MSREIIRHSILPRHRVQQHNSRIRPFPLHRAVERVPEPESAGELVHVYTQKSAEIRRPEDGAGAEGVGDYVAVRGVGGGLTRGVGLAVEEEPLLEEGRGNRVSEEEMGVREM